MVFVRSLTKPNIDTFTVSSPTLSRQNTLQRYVLISRGHVIQLQKVNTRHILSISNFLQITDRYDNHKYILLKPFLSFGMSWLFFLHDRDIFPSSCGNVTYTISRDSFAFAGRALSKYSWDTCVLRRCFSCDIELLWVKGHLLPMAA